MKMGTIGLDGTKIHTNASRRGALSYEHAGKIEEQLKAEVADLMAKAEAADAADIADGIRSPTNWRGARSVCARSPRRAATIEARAGAARARERHAREKAEHDAQDGRGGGGPGPPRRERSPGRPGGKDRCRAIRST